MALTQGCRGVPYEERGNPQVVDRRSLAAKAGIIRGRVGNARIRAANVPQFRRGATPTHTPVNSFNSRKTLGRLKRTHIRVTRMPSRLIRGNNPRADAYTHAHALRSYLRRIRVGPRAQDTQPRLFIIC